MQKSQIGFTLIELIVVIVLLGILGVTALGKFENLATDAQNAANSGVAAEISSSAAINYATNLVNGGGVAMTAANDDCAAASLQGLFQSGTFPTGYVPDNPTPVGACTAAGDTYTCDINDDPNNDGNAADAIGVEAIATIICTGP